MCEALCIQGIILLKSFPFSFQKRRFDLENASSKVTSPLTPVQTPTTIQRRLQKAGAVDDSDITSASLAVEAPQTSGGKVRTRVENLKMNYEKQVQKVHILACIM